MTSFDCDAYTGATPLAALKNGESVSPRYQNQRVQSKIVNPKTRRGCCSFVCPAKRPLTQTIKSMRKIQLGKRRKK